MGRYDANFLLGHNRDLHVTSIVVIGTAVANCGSRLDSETIDKNGDPWIGTYLVLDEELDTLNGGSSGLRDGGGNTTHYW